MFLDLFQALESKQRTLEYMFLDLLQAKDLVQGTEEPMSVDLSQASVGHQPSVVEIVIVDFGHVINAVGLSDIVMEYKLLDLDLGLGAGQQSFSVGTRSMDLVQPLDLIGQFFAVEPKSVGPSQPLGLIG